VGRVPLHCGKPLERYFPDVVESLAALSAKRFVLDSEIVIPVDGRLSFYELLLRVHPAESRVARRLTLDRRRPRLEAFTKKYFPARSSIVRRGSVPWSKIR